MDSTLALGAFRIARGAGGEAVDVNGNLVEREVPPGGAEGSFLCSLSTNDSASGGVFALSLRDSLPIAMWGASWVHKKCVRLASVFPSPPFGSSDFAGPRRPRLYGFHTGTRSLSNRKGRGRRSGT